MAPVSQSKLLSPAPDQVGHLATYLVDELLEPGTNSSASRLVELGVAWWLAQPLGQLVEPSWLARTCVSTLMADNGLNKFFERHLHIAYIAERKRADESQETLADAMPQKVVDAIAARMGRRTGLPAGFGTNIVDPVLVRELIATSLAESLEAFLARLPFGGGNGGLLGNIARKGASRIKSAGSVLSQVGSGVQANVRRQAQEFASQSADKIKEGFVSRLMAPDNQPQLDAMRRRLVDAVLGLPLSDAYALADDPGQEVLWDWLAEVIAHNMNRPEIRDALEQQITEGLGRDSDRSVGSLLDEFGLLESVHEFTKTQGVRHLQGLVATESFRGWLVELLEVAWSDKTADV